MKTIYNCNNCNRSHVIDENNFVTFEGERFQVIQCICGKMLKYWLDKKEGETL